MSKRHGVRGAVALWLTLGLVVAGRAAAVTLTLVPSAGSVAPGGSVEVAVVVSGLGNLGAPSLGGFDHVLSFDDAIFAFTGVAVGTRLGNPGAAEAIFNSVLSDPTLTAVEVSLLPAAELDGLQPGSFTLLTATFQATGSGSGDFGLSVNALSDELGQPLPVTSLQGTTVIAGGPGGGTVPVPTLSSWSLLLLTVVLLAVGTRLLRRSDR